MPIRSVASASAALLLALGAAASTPAPYETALRFLREGRALRVLDLASLRAGCPPVEVAIADPYYGRPKRFVTCPMRRVLELGFAGHQEGLADATLLLRARDGYIRVSAAQVLNQPGAHLAYADAERARGDDPGWEPIDRRQVDPGPFYLVWSGSDQADVHRYPWPYQLAEIEWTALERVFPHLAPRGLPPEHPAWGGFATFRRDCLACHALNGEGGKVGPDLNVPRSVIEYRPEAQLRAFIRDPGSFRYSSMPSHLHIGDAELDALLAYLRAMSERKHDPGAAP